VRRPSYVLTARAAADLKEARAWSRARWGTDLTAKYFGDLHEAAQFIAENHESLRRRQQFGEGLALLLHPVREHYIVYEPLGERLIAVVALIRQGRDIPAILQKWAAPIRRELLEIRARIGRGEITVRTRTPAAKSRRKK
jgi:plasmid stabilization system protein ParE